MWKESVWVRINASAAVTDVAAMTREDSFSEERLSGAAWALGAGARGIGAARRSPCGLWIAGGEKSRVGDATRRGWARS